MCRELGGTSEIVVFNDEAHHCYRGRAAAPGAGAATMSTLTGEARTEAKRREEQARVWFDTELPRLWGQLKAQAQAAGHPLGQPSQTNDLWICATAIYHDAPLLALNHRHFENFPNLVVLHGHESAASHLDNE